MTTGKEGIQPPPTLHDLITGATERFHARKLDESGFGPNHLDMAVIHTMTASGLNGSQILEIVRAGSTLDDESIQVTLEESREYNPDQFELVAAGRLIVEEITRNDSATAIENAKRIQAFTGPIEGKVV